MKDKICPRDRARGAESRRKGFEKDISTQQRFQEEDSRVQAAHEDPERTPYNEKKARQRKEADSGLTRGKPDLRFPREATIRSRADYLKVQNTGQRTRGRNLIILFIDNGLPITRFGITVSRKTGNAITRNRIKRRLREIQRQNRSRFVSGKDMVVIATRQAPGASYAELEREYLKLADAAGLAEGTTPA